MYQKKIRSFPKNRGLGGDSSISNANPYRVLPRFKGIDKNILIAQIRGLYNTTLFEMAAS